MTDLTSSPASGAFSPEPAHDPHLGALIRDGVGATPSAAVDWTALAQRITSALATQLPAPWWTWATRWERRAIPMSLAAGIAAALALWSTSPATATSPLTSASEVATAVVSGTSAEDAAVQFARSITNAADLTQGVPE